MSNGLLIRRAGPGLSLQDFGRSGGLVQGLSRGGAMDPLALFEGAALLRQSPDLAALEMAGMGGAFEATAACRIALSGAPMRCSIDGAAVAWGSSFELQPGQILDIGPALRGCYGYLHLGGGIAAPIRLGARSAHLTAGIGTALAEGDTFPAGPDPGTEIGLMLEPADRFAGGTLRLLPTVHTESFPQELRDRLATTPFTRDPRSNRMAVRLAFDGPGFQLEGGLSVLSEVTVPGDLQVTGDGVPVVLMAEAQTTGGYPRIATILPADLPLAAQCPVGATLRFRWIDLDEALAAERAAALGRTALRDEPRPRRRDPRDIPDLLGYHLIDGAVTGKEEEP